MTKKDLKIGMRVVLFYRRKYREGTILELSHRYEGDHEPTLAKVAYDSWWIRNGWEDCDYLYPIDGVATA